MMVNTEELWKKSILIPFSLCATWRHVSLCMPNTLFRECWGIFFVAFFVTASGNAATFEPAKRPDGTSFAGSKIEGEIVPGDAKRLLDFYGKYGDLISPLYLRSRGGDVAEAMQMGSIIRRLRLETSVPVWDAAKAPIDLIHVDHPENEVCASACFLVYAGGAVRSGNYLALHRPYLPRDEARSISDAEYEALQKQMAVKVKAYLSYMEIDSYWVDRMFSASSQDFYIPTWNEADSKMHHLMDLVPSLEEVVLSKCNEDPQAEQKFKELAPLAGSPSTFDQAKVAAAWQQVNVFYQCKNSALSKMRDAAFERENEGAIAEMCKQSPTLTGAEQSALIALLRKGASATPDEANGRTLLFNKNWESENCRSGAILNLTLAIARNWRAATHGASP